MLQRRHASIGGVLIGLGAALLLLVGSFIDADAFLLLMLLPALALAIYLFEMTRAAFQGSLDFFSYSAGWIGWRATQYVMAGLAIYVFGTAWAGITGILWPLSLAQ